MSKRTLFLLSVLIGLLLAAAWSRPVATPPGATPEPSTLWSWIDHQAQPLLYANHPDGTRDSVTETEALRHIEQLYRTQADILAAQSRGATTQANRLLDRTIHDLQQLAQQPGLATHPRFRRAFQTITAEYREQYGIPDTLALPQGDIYDLRQSLFTSLNDASVPLTETILSDDLWLTNTDVPMTINERVQESISFLLRRRHTYLYPWLRRSATYFPMIEQVFAEENVPDELKYLALVESGLDPHAKSHAQAVGPWQFVAATGRHYGLTIDPWVDERRDPEKATRAAARHLRDLHDFFGTWPLAIAGYNCSPRVIQWARAKARRRLDREPTFWDIYPDLPEETRNYLPLYIATAVIVSNPAAFDLDRVDTGPRYAYDHIPVSAPLTLTQVAQLARSDASTLRALNPELRTDQLPPSAEPYYVRLPYGTYETFARNYAAMQATNLPAPLQHVVQPSETVGRIAERYHVDRRRLLRTNSRHLATIAVGETLRMPDRHYAGNAQIAERAEAQPIRVRYGSRATRPLAVSPPIPGTVTADAGLGE